MWFDRPELCLNLLNDGVDGLDEAGPLAGGTSNERSLHIARPLETENDFDDGLTITQETSMSQGSTCSISELENFSTICFP